MAKDFLNVIERALMMGISDSINALTESGEDIYVFGAFLDVFDSKNISGKCSKLFFKDIVIEF